MPLYTVRQPPYPDIPEKNKMRRNSRIRRLGVQPQLTDALVETEQNETPTHDLNLGLPSVAASDRSYDRNKLGVTRS